MYLVYGKQLFFFFLYVVKVLLFIYIVYMKDVWCERFLMGKGNHNNNLLSIFLYQLMLVNDSVGLALNHLLLWQVLVVLQQELLLPYYQLYICDESLCYWGDHTKLLVHMFIFISECVKLYLGAMHISGILRIIVLYHCIDFPRLSFFNTEHS